MTDLRERVLAAVAVARPLPRAEARRRDRGLLVLAGLSSLLVFVVAGGFRPFRPYDRPFALWAATSVGATAIAAAALALALRRGGSMLGRSAPFLLALALATPVLLVLWKVGVSSAFPGMTVPWEEKPGYKCLALAGATGIVPAAMFLYLWRGTAPAHPRLTGMALGTAAGAFAWVLVDLWCPVAYFPHLLLGHVLPLVLLAGIGAAAGGVLQPRRR